MPVEEHNSTIWIAAYWWPAVLIVMALCFLVGSSCAQENWQSGKMSIVGVHMRSGGEDSAICKHRFKKCESVAVSQFRYGNKVVYLERAIEMPHTTKELEYQIKNTPKFGAVDEFKFYIDGSGNYNLVDDKSKIFTFVPIPKPDENAWWVIKAVLIRESSAEPVIEKTVPKKTVPEKSPKIKPSDVNPTDGWWTPTEKK